MKSELNIPAFFDFQQPSSAIHAYGHTGVEVDVH